MKSKSGFVWVVLLVLLLATGCEALSLHHSDDDDDDNDDSNDDDDNDSSLLPDDDSLPDDDDSSDDDSVPGDDDIDDDTDDDTDDDVDDDTSEWFFQAPAGQIVHGDKITDLLCGGQPGGDGVAVAFDPDGTAWVAAAGNGFLYTYTFNGIIFLTEYVAAETSDPRAVTGADGERHLLYYEGKTLPQLIYATQHNGQWVGVDTGMPSSAPNRAPEFCLDEAGAAHVALLHRNTGKATYEVYYGTDSGGEWTSELIAEVDWDHGQAPQIACDGPQVRLYYAHRIEYGNYPLFMAERDDKGWQIEQIVTAEDDGVAFAPATLVDGAPLLFMRDQRDSFQLLSRDGGGWNAETVATSEFYNYDGAGLTVDEDGYRHILLLALDHVWRYFTDASGEWTEEIAADEIHDLEYADSVLTGDGLMAGVGFDDWALRIRWVANTSGSWKAATVHERRPCGEFSLTARPDGVPYVAFVEGNQICVAKLAGDEWLYQVADPVAASTAGLDVAFAPNGTLHLSYLDYENSYHNVCHTWKQGGEWLSEVVDNQIDTLTSLAIDAAGRVHLAWATDDYTYYAVKDGDVWTRETVAPNTRTPALALDEQGRPHIAVSIVDNGLFWFSKQDGQWVHEKVIDEAGGDMAMEHPAIIVHQGQPHVFSMAGTGTYFSYIAVVAAHRTGENAWVRERLYSVQIVWSFWDTDLVDLAVDGAGVLHSVFNYGGGGDPSPMRLGAWDEAWTKRPIGNWGAYPRLAFGGSTEANVAYRYENGLWVTRFPAK
ncbi:MAG TPA: hypothetical protein PKW95_02160 [bacterium]|nr:hypothetical protein [bacterium]